MEPERAEEISIKKLWLMIWYRLPLIVFTGLIGLIIGFIVFFIKPEKYPVSATVKINYLKGIDHYSGSEIAYLIKEDRNLEAYVDDVHTLASLKEDLNVFIAGDTGYLKLNVDSTSDPDFWINLIGNTITIFNDALLREYLSKADNEMKNISETLETIKSIVDNNQDKSIYGNLLMKYSELSENVDQFDCVLQVISVRSIVERVSKGKFIVALLGAFIGCFIGGILTLIAGFSDKKLRLSEDVKCNARYGRLILTLPFYKESVNIDNRVFEYIATLIEDKGEKIMIFSLHDKSGSSTFADGLKKYYESKCSNVCCCNDFDDAIDSLQICDSASFESSPSVISNAKKSDIVIVILNKDKDLCTDLRQIDENLHSVGCKNIYYVFNFSCRNDVDALKYQSNSSFKKEKFIFWK